MAMSLQSCCPEGDDEVRGGFARAAEKRDHFGLAPTHFCLAALSRNFLLRYLDLFSVASKPDKFRIHNPKPRDQSATGRANARNPASYSVNSPYFFPIKGMSCDESRSDPELRSHTNSGIEFKLPQASFTMADEQNGSAGKSKIPTIIFAFSAAPPFRGRIILG